MQYKSLSSWAMLLSIILTLLTIVLLVNGSGMGLVVGISLGIGFGSAFGAIAATACHSYDRKKDRQLMEHFIYEHSQAQVIYKADPLVVEGLGRLTSSAVLNGECCFCLSDHPGLLAHPFSPLFHRNNPRCPVPLSRELFETYRNKESGHSCPSELIRVEMSELENQPTKRLLPQDLRTKNIDEQNLNRAEQMTSTKNLYYVDCFDAQFWLWAENSHEAERIAEQKAGHADVNETLLWSEHIWASTFECAEDVAEVLELPLDNRAQTD